MAGWMITYEGIAWVSQPGCPLNEAELVEAIENDPEIALLSTRAGHQDWELIVRAGEESQAVVVVLGVDRLPSRFVSIGEIHVDPTPKDPLPSLTHTLVGRISGALAQHAAFKTPTAGLVFIGFS